MRMQILKLLTFVPDKLMLRLQYRIKYRRSLNLKNPKRYTEKIQLYKLYYRNPVLHECVDKYRVKNYIRRKGLDIKIPELYGVYKKGEDIDFTSLPSRFVIKMNDGGGANNVIICDDKEKLDVPATVKLLNSWHGIKNIDAGREWAYTGIKESLIIIEQLLENENNPEAGIEDFKFFCFNGEPVLIQHDGDRNISHWKNFYDLDWKRIKLKTDYENYEGEDPRPDNLDRMTVLARELSKEFPHVRVDFYSIGKDIYFGELTFYPYSGYVPFDPDEFDFVLGEKFDVSSFTPKK